MDPESALQFMHTDASAALVWSLYERSISNEVLNVCGSGTVHLSEVRQWCGRDVIVASHAPLVRYEVSMKKLAGYTPVPETRSAVRAFVGVQQRDGSHG
jgi:hypothetical protein